MQIKDNITAIAKPNEPKLQGPIKMVKLRSKDNVARNADLIMKSLENVTPINQETSAPVNTPTPETTPSVNPESTATVTNELPLTSEEVLKSKQDILGISAYRELVGNIIPFESIQTTSRRLKTNPVVPGNINRERNVNGINMILASEENEVSTEEMVPEDGMNGSLEETTPEETNYDNNQTFDFGSLPGMDGLEPPTEEYNNYSNDTSMDFEQSTNGSYNENVPGNNNDRLDEWLNKETGMTSSDDGIINEVSELQARRDANANNLANQREILEALRARIASNDELCRAKKRELEEDDMNITRELKDVLDEISRLKGIADEQEAFLGINEDESYMGKVA